MRLKLKTTKKTRQNIKQVVTLLKADKEIREIYSVTVQNTYNAMEV